MKTQIQRGQTVRRARVAILLILTITVLLMAYFCDPISGERPLVIRFLYYTNNAARARIAVMEISNRTDTPYHWTLHSDAKGASHVLAVTDLIDPNGQLRAVSPCSGGTLFDHAMLRFGTDDFEIGKRFWFKVTHYPKTADELRRERVSAWLWRCKLRLAASYVAPGQRINGPVPPLDETYPFSREL